jgi:hypothetical protein
MIVLQHQPYNMSTRYVPTPQDKAPTWFHDRVTERFPPTFINEPTEFSSFTLDEEERRYSESFLRFGVRLLKELNIVCLFTAEYGEFSQAVFPLCASLLLN